MAIMESPETPLYNLHGIFKDGSLIDDRIDKTIAAKSNRNMRNVQTYRATQLFL